MILAAILAAGWSASPAEEKPADNGTVSGWKDKIQRDLSRLNFSTDESLLKAEQEIRDKHSFMVTCDRGWMGIGGALSVENCAIGLTRLSAALDQIKPNLSADLLKNTSIQLSRPGLWQGLTFQGREMKIPYNANPELMSKFLHSELTLVYATSLGDLFKANERLADRIQKKYFVKVSPAPDLDVYQTHDGLKKAEVAMFLVAGANPQYSEGEAKKLGFDTVVLDSRSSKIFEDSGELRMKLSYTDHPGEMFMHMVNAGKPSERKWLSTHWSALNWNDVQAFREDKQRVLQTAVALKSALAVDEVQCELNSAQSGAVTMRDCRAGLENLQRAASNNAGLKGGKGVGGVIIKDLNVVNYEYDAPTKRLFLDHKASPEKIAEAFSAPGT